MSAKARIIEFIDKIGISKRQFYAQTGLSNGALDKAENIGTDKVEKIYSAYPQINLEWLITGKGEMIVTNVATTIQENSDNSGNVSGALTLNQISQRLIKLENEVQSLRDKVYKGKGSR